MAIHVDGDGQSLRGRMSGHQTGRQEPCSWRHASRSPVGLLDPLPDHGHRSHQASPPDRVESNSLAESAASATNKHAHCPGEHRLMRACPDHSRRAAQASRGRTVLDYAVGLRDLGEGEGLLDRDPEAPGLDQFADPGRPADPVLNVTPCSGAPSKSASVTRRVDAVGRECTDALDEALAVGDGLSANQTARQRRPDLRRRRDA